MLATQGFRVMGKLGSGLSTKLSTNMDKSCQTATRGFRIMGKLNRFQIPSTAPVPTTFALNGLLTKLTILSNGSRSRVQNNGQGTIPKLTPARQQAQCNNSPKNNNNNKGHQLRPAGADDINS